MSWYCYFLFFQTFSQVFQFFIWQIWSDINLWQSLWYHQQRWQKQMAIKYFLTHSGGSNHQIFDPPSQMWHIFQVGSLQVEASPSFAVCPKKSQNNTVWKFNFSLQIRFYVKSIQVNGIESFLKINSFAILNLPQLISRKIERQENSQISTL